MSNPTGNAICAYHKRIKEAIHAERIAMYDEFDEKHKAFNAGIEKAIEVMEREHGV